MQALPAGQLKGRAFVGDAGQHYRRAVGKLSD